MRRTGCEGAGAEAPGFGRWGRCRWQGVVLGSVVLGRPGDDLLSQVLRHSTIGAEEFNGRVRDGIGFRLLATATRPAKDKDERRGICRGQLRCKMVSANRRFVASAQTAGLSVVFPGAPLSGRRDERTAFARESIGNESDQADQAISTG